MINSVSAKRPRAGTLLRCESCRRGWVAYATVEGSCRRCGGRGTALVARAAKRAMVLARADGRDAATRLADAMRREGFTTVTRLAGPWSVMAFVEGPTDDEISRAVSRVSGTPGVVAIERFACESRDAAAR